MPNDKYNHMIGKKDNHDIFNQYKQVLVEQVLSNDVINSLLNRVKTATMDKQLKYDIIDYIKRCETSFPSSKSQHGEHDADAAGYASYPEAKPAMDQDDTESVNEPDPKFAEELAKARKEQQEEYPEKDESEEGEYADPASFFGGPTTPISKMGPMKFEPRITPKVKTPQEKAEEEAYWAAREQENQRRKLEQIERAKANRKTSATHVPDEKIGASTSDPEYDAKKARWMAAFAAGAGRQ